MVKPSVAAMHDAAFDWIGHPVVGEAGALRQRPHVDHACSDPVETALRNRIVWEPRADRRAAGRIGRGRQGIVDTVWDHTAEIAGPNLSYRHRHHLRVAEHLPVTLVIGEEKG